MGRRSRWDMSHNFKAKRTEYKSPLVGTRLYDSKSEAAYAAELDMLWMAKKIFWWLPQVRLPLPGGISYYVDFQYQCSITHEVKWVDVKGRITQVSKNKIKQVEDICGIEVQIVK